MANQMNLLKLREWEEHNVINLYSTMEGDINKGTLVEYFIADPDNQNGYGVSFSNVPTYAFSKDYGVNWKVQAASAYSNKLAGMLLYSVVTNLTDPWVIDARFADPAKLAEKQLVISGKAVPFVTKGRFEVSGIDITSGVPGPGSGAYLSASGAGIIATGPGAPVVSYGDLRPRVGTFLTQSGVNGGIYLALNINNSY